MSERIWCVPAELVHERRIREGFWTFGAATANEAFVAELGRAGEFRSRREVETDERWRQVIPYLLLREPGGGYFTYRRLPAGGEARLVDLHSLGVGGHINDSEMSDGLRYGAEILRPNVVAHGLQRELAEELVLPRTAPGGLGRVELHGFLALNATPVDRVHVGVVVIVHLAGEHVAGCDVRETDKLQAVGWRRPAELRADLERFNFEGWSRAVIEAGLP